MTTTISQYVRPSRKEISLKNEIIKDNKERHYCIIYISPELLMDFLKPAMTGQAFRCIKGLPEGSRIVRAGLDEETGRFAIMAEHPDFLAVCEGEKIPELESLVFEKINACRV